MSGNEGETGTGGGRPGIRDRLRGLKEFSAAVVGRFKAERCPVMASSLSFMSLLGVVPLAAIGFAVLQAVPAFDGVREDLEGLLFANLVPESAEVLRAHFDMFVENAGALSAFGAVGLMVTALLLLADVERSLNAIFRAEGERPALKRITAYVALIILGPLLVGLSFVAAAYLFAVTARLGIDPFSGPLSGLAKLMPTLIIVVLLLLFYAITPNRKVDIGAAAVGALTAGVLFLVLRVLFGVYIDAFPVYQTIYGALAVVPILLVWTYLVWTVVLLGAVLTAVLDEWQAGPRGPASG